VSTNIQALYQTISKVCAQCMDRMKSPMHLQHLMSMLLALIGLTGTDFTRNLLQMNGKSVFWLLPDLMVSYNPMVLTTGQLDVWRKLDQLHYARHGVKSAPTSLHHMFEALQPGSAPSSKSPSARETLCQALGACRLQRQFMIGCSSTGTI
jgi:hypothetical protein